VEIINISPNGCILDVFSSVIISLPVVYWDPEKSCSDLEQLKF